MFNQVRGSRGDDLLLYLITVLHASRLLKDLIWNIVKLICSYLSVFVFNGSFVKRVTFSWVYMPVLLIYSLVKVEQN